MRPSGRTPQQLRPIALEAGVTRHAEGSCLVEIRRYACHLHGVAGRRKCRLEEGLRQGLGDGGIRHAAARHAYARRREAAKGKQSGRTQEIQRLIGRALRAVTDHEGFR
jgi:ribonuclease PH